MKNRNAFIPILMAGFTLCIGMACFPQTVNASYQASYPLPKLSGNCCDDLISVAESQLGYTESSTGETIYADWAGQPGRPWCSEFISRCANKAKIPTSIIPVGTSSNAYRDFFSKQGNYYVISGNDNTSCGCRKKASKTISVSEIRKGDILLVETSGGFSNGPDHASLVVSVDNGIITTIDGNTNNQVRYRTRTATFIHGVCRPMYQLTGISLRAKKTAGKNIKLKWNKLSNVKGYQIYRSTSKKSGYRLLKTIKKKNNMYKNTRIISGTRYYYKIRAFQVRHGKKIYGSFSNIVSCKIK